MITSHHVHDDLNAIIQSITHPNHVQTAMYMTILLYSVRTAMCMTVLMHTRWINRQKQTKYTIAMYDHFYALHVIVIHNSHVHDYFGVLHVMLIESIAAAQ